MFKAGANIIDVGGESTRPGAKKVNEKLEWKRIKNVIIEIKKKFLILNMYPIIEKNVIEEKIPRQIQADGT